MTIPAGDRVAEGQIERREVPIGLAVNGDRVGVHPLGKAGSARADRDVAVGLQIGAVNLMSMPSPNSLLLPLRMRRPSGDH